MREAVANLIYPVLLQGLRLRESLDRGQTPDLDQEQASLKGLLGASAQQVAVWVALGGQLLEQDPHLSARLPPRPAFHYALVCWLDEIFSDRSAWGVEWTERTLEMALYDTRDRAWKFPEQAKRALNRSAADETEVFYLCVMLGFRGDWREHPADLQSWVEAAEARLKQSQSGEWPNAPTGGEAPSSAPPLRGRERLERMLSVVVTALLVLIPAITFFLVLYLGQS
jgi:type VI secretion system protein ImpK